MKRLLTITVFLCSILALTAQVELESIAKSEMAGYLQLKNHQNKRASGGNIDIVYAALSLKPNMQTAFLNGSVNYFFLTSGPINRLNFDLRKSLTVDSVIFRHQATNFIHHDDHTLDILLNQIVLPQTLDSLRIYYHGTPEQGNRAYERSVTASGPIIATLSEPYGAHYWWPCRENLSDKIDSLDVMITVDTIYKAASNGLLKSITVKDSMHTYHWHSNYPIVTYLVAFSASRYSTYSDYALLSNGKNIEILNYVFPHNETDSRIKTKATIPVMHLFDSLFGTYPFHKERYGHAQFTVGGGMEHQTMSFMGNFGYDLIAHELAHQWFGDKITCGTWEDLWLNESFATYCNLLCYDFLRTETEWYNQLKNFERDVLSQEGGSVKSKDTVNVGALFNYRTTYQKGALVLHQLRWLIGDKAFFEGVRNYITSTSLSYNFAKEADFKYFMEQASGVNLDDYFADWISGEGYPTYNINLQQTGSAVAMDVNQTQSHPSVDLYTVPLPVLLKGIDKDSLIVIPINSTIENLRINLPFIVNEIIVDPYQWIIGKSVTNIAASDLYTLYPNPSNHVFNVSLNNIDLSGWEVIDATGKSVFTKNYPENIPKGSIETFDLTSLAHGIYTIVLKTPDQSYTNKIILK